MSKQREQGDHDPVAESTWRQMLLYGDLDNTRRLRRIFKHLPSSPRCVQCNAPFRGIGGLAVRWLMDLRPSTMNPRFCGDCEVFARKHLGGAEVEVALLFADIRGSTALAERTDAVTFSRLINRFYATTSDVLIRSDALIEKLVGDEITALYAPGFAGPDYARRAIESAEALLEATGHREPRGPWVPVGVGVHWGRAFVGAVGSDSGMVEITTLGDTPNTTARLASTARAGEVLISEAACNAAGFDTRGLERRDLSVKGRSEPISVRVLRVTRQSAA